MPSTYADLSLTEAIEELARRLAAPVVPAFGDESSGARYTFLELSDYIIESLRTFSALSGMWQDTAVAEIPAGTAFIDLPTTFPTLLGYTVTDAAISILAMNQLFEPRDATGLWTGASEMFSAQQFIDALQRRHNQFIRDTACHITRYPSIPVAPLTLGPGSTEINLDPRVVDIVRAAWTASDGKTSALWASSATAQRGQSPTWNREPGQPKSYLYNQRAPIVIELAPPPANDGVIDILANDLPDTSFVLDPTVLEIPDDFTPFVKWGILADLLSADGPARDYARSLFCERRYQMGVAAARNIQIVLEVRLNDLPAQFASIESLDSSPQFIHWQNRTAPAPKIVSMIGQNMIAIAFPPSRPCSVKLTAIRNVPIPAGVNDSLQIPREYTDLILGYAEHLAMFKIGGQEFAATTHLANAFFAAADDYAGRTEALSVFEDDQRQPQHPIVKARAVQRETGNTVR